jgi:hypothetical protein
MSNVIDKKLRQLEKGIKKEKLIKFKKGEHDSKLKLEPYERERIDTRDLLDNLEESDFPNE